jgi:hypothetical protein
VSKKQVAIFLSLCAFAAAIAWIAGYDFNQRGPGVAYWVALTVATSAVVAVLFSGDSP